jgi:hypothetical protein
MERHSFPEMRKYELDGHPTKISNNNVLLITGRM